MTFVQFNPENAFKYIYPKVRVCEAEQLWPEQVDAPISGVAFKTH